MTKSKSGQHSARIKQDVRIESEHLEIASAKDSRHIIDLVSEDEEDS
jgi:hypothetical protein